MRKIALVLGLFLLGACAPPSGGRTPGPAPVPAAGLPAIPPMDGELRIQVVHPRPEAPRPAVDSTFIYGSVGTGRASLTINGTPVEVAPNGAFLAYLPVPQTEGWRLEAQAHGRTTSTTVTYRAPAPAGAAADRAPPPTMTEFNPARVGVVTGGADTLATGSDVAIGRPIPNGTYRWFLPRGARLTVTGRMAEQWRVRLGDSTAWFPAEVLTVSEVPPPPAPRPLGPATVRLDSGWVDVRLPVGGAPFQVQTTDSSVALLLFGVAPPSEASLDVPPNRVLTSGTWSLWGQESARLELRLGRRLWGYKAFYEPNGNLVLRLRRPPDVDPANPLRGRRILIDPGHPPAGATGPTGLTEAEANLQIALRLATQLRARGAQVLLTRTDNSPVPLTARVEQAVHGDAELLVSVHNNAFAEGVNPFRNHGTSVYYFHPFSAALARALNREIVGVTRIPDLGARQSNLALVRPTWMPSALTESLYMLIPQHEAALREPAFLDRLATAHVRGIEAFLREQP